MNNLIYAITVCIAIIICTFFVCKHIENKNLKKYIKILCGLLLLWLIIRIIKYDFIKDASIKRLFWYLYYFPMLFCTTTFLNISTWNNKNKRYIKVLKTISVIGSIIIFSLVLTNDLHQLVFKLNFNLEDVESDYKYGIVYYIYFIWMFINIGISIVETIRESRGLYKKQKFTVLSIMFLLVFVYAIGYANKTPFISTYAKDFTVIYCIFFMLALIIIVYKEKYRETLEEQLYEEIESAIKDKTILISKKINDISNSKDKKRDLAYIKMLVSYCKKKSNLIVTQKNKDNYTSNELELFIKEIIKDANSLGIFGDVRLVNKFDIPIYVASIIYSYIYNLFEYCSKYNSTNMFISIEKVKDKININTIIDSKDILDDFEYNFEMSKFISSEKIDIKKLKEDNSLSIVLNIQVNVVVIKEANLTEKEIRTLLEIKSKVHDILGQRLSIVSKITEEGIIEENKIEEIKPLLKNILEDLGNDKQKDPNEILMQISQTCELAGTKVYIIGDLPKNYLKAITLVRIIRECSTNAIRHAKAENIYIQIMKKDKIEMIISNDGEKRNTFTEGDGIKGMRHRIEELNGSLEIITDDDFTVKVRI